MATKNLTETATKISGLDLIPKLFLSFFIIVLIYILFICPYFFVFLIFHSFSYHIGHTVCPFTLLLPSEKTLTSQVVPDIIISFIFKQHFETKNEFLSIVLKIFQSVTLL